MGSRSKINLAYIAGFLDGDGSLMIQLKSRVKEGLPHRLMFTTCFYQDSRHEETLSWIRTILGIGYISKRNDGMTELRINGYRQTRDVLAMLLPYIRFKHVQAHALHHIATIVSKRRYLRKLSLGEKEVLLRSIVTVQNNNYASRKKKSESELRKILGLTP